MAAAAFVVLEPDSFDLSYDGPVIDTDHTIKFDTRNVDAGEWAVLSFDVNPGNADDISVQWTLNNTDILKQTFDTGRDARAWQAVVPKNLLKTQGNSLTVRLADSDLTGSVSFGDIVVMYTQKL